MPFLMPPPMFLPFDEFDDPLFEEEDPFEVIRKIERERRRPSGFGGPFHGGPPMINVRPEFIGE